MAVDPGSVEHLTEIISHVIAPSFLLGAVASFISMLLGRMGAVLERVRFLNSLPDDDPRQTSLRQDLPRLLVRVKRLHWSILLAIGAGIVTTMLIMGAFLMAFANIHHGELTAFMFIAALAFFFFSLSLLAMEVLIAVNEYDHF
jgi:amino acid transporter